MYEADGWKNIAKTLVITSMLVVNHRPYLLHTHNMTGRPKTGDTLWAIVLEDREYAQTMFDVEIIEYCSDNGPDGKKAQLLNCEQTPKIIDSVCWAHQSSLVTGNLLTVGTMTTQSVSQSTEIVKFFNNHAGALDKLKLMQGICSPGSKLQSSFFSQLLLIGHGITVAFVEPASWREH